MFPCLHRELCTGIQRQRSVHKKKKALKGSSIDGLLFMSAAFKKRMKLANGDAGALLESIGKKEEPKEEKPKKNEPSQTPWPGCSTHRRSDGQFSPCVQGTIGSILPPARVHHVRHRRSCPLGDSEKKFEKEKVSLTFATI